MADNSKMKLGKGPAKMDGKRLFLKDYLPPSLPTPPDSQDWCGAITDWTMMGNDRLGDCVFAGLGHAIQDFTANATGTMVTIPDADIIRMYSLWAGYDPAQEDQFGDNPTDQGYIEVDALNKWRASDFAGHKLLGYADVDPGDTVRMKQTILLLGGIYLGLDMPEGWQTADVWDAKMGSPGSWGGHAVWGPSYVKGGTVVGYTKDGIVVITWGQPKLITWKGLAQYCDETHALLSPDFITAKNVSASGFKLDSLQSDLQALGGGSDSVTAL